MSAEEWDEDTCHCGRQALVNEALGHSRGMCQDCDATRCDAYPSECPFERHRLAVIRAIDAENVPDALAKAWDEGWAFSLTGQDPAMNPYRSKS